MNYSLTSSTFFANYSLENSSLLTVSQHNGNRCLTLCRLWSVFSTFCLFTALSWAGCSCQVKIRSPPTPWNRTWKYEHLSDSGINDTNLIVIKLGLVWFNLCTLVLVIDQLIDATFLSIYTSTLHKWMQELASWNMPIWCD